MPSLTLEVPKSTSGAAVMISSRSVKPEKQNVSRSIVLRSVVLVRALITPRTTACGAAYLFLAVKKKKKKERKKNENENESKA